MAVNPSCKVRAPHCMVLICLSAWHSSTVACLEHANGDVCACVQPLLVCVTTYIFACRRISDLHDIGSGKCMILVYKWHGRCATDLHLICMHTFRPGPTCAVHIARWCDIIPHCPPLHPLRLHVGVKASCISPCTPPCGHRPPTQPRAT